MLLLGNIALPKRLELALLQSSELLLGLGGQGEQLVDPSVRGSFPFPRSLGRRSERVKLGQLPGLGVQFFPELLPIGLDLGEGVLKSIEFFPRVRGLFPSGDAVGTISGSYFECRGSSRGNFPDRSGTDQTDPWPPRFRGLEAHLAVVTCHLPAQHLWDNPQLGTALGAVDPIVL
jgi:hypothetical protein